MPVRAIVTDLDGTLLRTDGTVSARSVGALVAAEAAGILVVIATARPPRSIRHLIEQFGNRGVAVCSNGSIVYDTARHAVVETHDLTVEDAREIVKRLRANFPAFALGVEQGLLCRRDEHYVSSEDDGVEIGRLETFLDRPTSTIFAKYPGEPTPDVLPQVRQLLDGLATVHVSDGRVVDLTRVGVNKANIVEAVIAKHNVGATEVVAFGDMPNDIELLAWAGHGVAVGNAHPDVLAIAGEITATNDADGVAIVVERLLQ